MGPQGSVSPRLFCSAACAARITAVDSEAAGSAAAAAAQKTILFVGQLPYDATADAVRRHFAASAAGGKGGGPVVRLLTDKGTGRGRGIGFVEFASEEAVEQGLRLDGSVFQGR